ncbi:endonuclease [Skermanella stibiiresistens SB22]|uniref:Endonuclease n=1 Tax=Skermanella stibiiresistens SB22 TaxID=1385369 RepID=W9HCE2_9PROT|nr:endonuclease/exonuclease/phosphatase family protein [Skermanella stibiiresistens]EWY41553.1 endonuclease [Skermanella stibiiresistens SB22]
MLKRLFGATLILAGLLLLLATALPFIRGNEWWVRIWDFPRAQVTVLLLVVGAGMVATFPIRKPFNAIFLAALGLAAAYQAWRVHPYTPLHGVEAIQAESCDDASRLRILVANVLMGNEDAESVLGLVRTLGPDMVLLLETNHWWDSRLNKLRPDYPHVVAHPQDDSYGMHLFSRLPLVNPRVRFLLEDYVPSIVTRVRLRSGEEIDFHGVHPMPPPLDDTDERDAELLLVARQVHEDPLPAVVAGDLNDVAWSRTTRRFQEISGLLDPRIGRGLYPTFNADWPLLRWPLDHIFFEEEFVLLDLKVLPDIGSDHFPVYVSLCHQPGAAAVHTEPAPDPDDLRDAKRAIREGREEANEPE